MRIETPHPKLGSISLVRNGLRMSDTPVQTHRGPPELGEHNDELLPSRNSR
jgi:formyl-CoA transferase